MSVMSKPGEMATIRRTKFSRPDAAAAGSCFVLAAVEGPDAGLVITLDGSGPTRALLGQSPVCAIRLKDPQVSRRHAAFGVTDAHLSLVDLGSTNGTTVNGVSVKEAFLLGGEAIRVGSTVLSVKRQSPRFVELTQAGAFGRVIGESAAMRKLYAVFSSLAASEGPVLLEGEAGTGKELVAEEIHLAGGRKDGPFITLEASAMATGDLGARLFGGGGEIGLLEQARGGILFVDEIGNLPRDTQTRLREMLAGEGAGGARVIAATSRDLDRDVASGRFDEDLFFALAAGRVELSPLRERDGDVALLARHFWVSLSPKGDAADAPAELPEDFLPRFEHYPWPGNVRELRSAVLARMTRGELGSAYRSDEAREHGLDFLSAVIEDDLPFPTARERVVQEFERRYVQRMLARHGSVAQAARASGVAHRYFQLVKARLK